MAAEVHAILDERREGAAAEGVRCEVLRPVRNERSPPAMRWRPLLLGVAALLPATLGDAAMAQAPQRCLSYHGRVQLEGVPVHGVFPGRPNYESTSSGDEPEGTWFLVTPTPFCVRPAPTDDPADPSTTPENGVDLVQLAFSQQLEAAIKVLHPGDLLRVSGTLSAAVSGHYHAREALLDVGVQRR